MEFLLVFLGGGLGSAIRHGANVLAAKFWGVQFPVGTLCINILGSFAMGLAMEYWAVKSGLPQQARLFLTTGVIGGFTTFSTFSLEVALLNSRGELMLAGLYIVGSLVLGIGGLYAGMALVRLAT
ncbi:fluoride efflux transporter CrcB [Pusillimonas sp. MFBS29]|uniref:fluoride efflux transporter CrcB n=1 Tax=Pusillimonas sp. MFBS29 TaxID=2886690 RepID=UPI001D118836|nr:fluoride efflux transporter CrcB [Pusillimonas sp. MFBS29]MCC2594738.1 fluoride efflux transporter CrcB [Pusillimonas sp. MFBS29]